MDEDSFLISAGTSLKRIENEDFFESWNNLNDTVQEGPNPVLNSIQDPVNSHIYGHDPRDQIKIKNFMKYPKLCKRCDTYSERLLSFNSIIVDDTDLEVFKQSTKNGYSKSKRNIYDSNTLPRKEFYRRVSVMRKWYDKLEIIKKMKEKEHNSENEKKITHEKKSVIVETIEGLDVKFSLGTLIDVLSCPLCKGLFYKAHTIKDCMHTFCRSCLILSTFQNGLKCPTCSTRIHRSLNDGIEYDHNIQGLVDKMFPEFTLEDKKQMRELEEYMKEQNMGLKVTEKGQVVQKFGRVIDSTTQFLKELVKEYEKMEIIMDQTVCLAILHESEDDINKVLCKVKFNDEEYRGNGRQKRVGKYPRKYVCVPRTACVYQLEEYMKQELELGNRHQIKLKIKNKIISKKEELGIICKDLKMDMTKWIVVRYLVSADHTR